MNPPSREEMEEFVNVSVWYGDNAAVMRFLNKYPAAANDRIDLGIDGEACFWTAMMAAVCNGRAETVALLIKRGADIEMKDDNGWTPLMFAAIHGHKNVAELLVKNGADINRKDNEGKTALTLSLECDRVNSRQDVIALLELETDMADFSPGLKRAIPALRPFKFKKGF